MHKTMVSLHIIQSMIGGAEWGTMPVLPTSAGLTSDYGADAPLGSGLLILGVLALGYTLIVTFLYRNKSSKMTSL